MRQQRGRSACSRHGGTSQLQVLLRSLRVHAPAPTLPQRRLPRCAALPPRPSSGCGLVTRGPLCPPLPVDESRRSRLWWHQMIRRRRRKRPDRTFRCCPPCRGHCGHALRLRPALPSGRFTSAASCSLRSLSSTFCCVCAVTAFCSRCTSRIPPSDSHSRYCSARTTISRAAANRRSDIVFMGAARRDSCERHRECLASSVARVRARGRPRCAIAGCIWSTRDRERDIDPVLICVAEVATAISAMVRIFCLAGTMRDDRGITCSCRHFDGCQCSGQGPDLVHLDQDRVGDSRSIPCFRIFVLVTNRSSPTSCTRRPSRCVQQRPSWPVTLAHAVFNGDDRSSGRRDPPGNPRTEQR